MGFARNRSLVALGALLVASTLVTACRSEGRQRAEAAPAVPHITEVVAVKRLAGDRVMMSDPQWKVAVGDLRQVQFLEPRHGWLEAHPSARPGGGVTLIARCPKGCTPRFEVEPIGPPRPWPGPGPVPVDYTPLPDTVWTPVCDCSGVEPDVPSPGYVPEAVQRCRMVVEVRRAEPALLSRLVFRCENVQCDRCRLDRKIEDDFVTKFSCECRLR